MPNTFSVIQDSDVRRILSKARIERDNIDWILIKKLRRKTLWAAATFPYVYVNGFETTTIRNWRNYFSRIFNCKITYPFLVSLLSTYVVLQYSSQNYKPVSTHTK